MIGISENYCLELFCSSVHFYGKACFFHLWFPWCYVAHGSFLLSYDSGSFLRRQHESRSIPGPCDNHRDLGASLGKNWEALGILDFLWPKNPAGMWGENQTVQTLSLSHRLIICRLKKHIYGFNSISINQSTFISVQTTTLCINRPSLSPGIFSLSNKITVTNVQGIPGIYR